MQDNYDIFEQYLNGELEGQVLSDLEEQLKTDAVLAKELELFRKVKAGISAKLQSHSGKEALLKTIGALEGEYFMEGQQNSDSETSGGPRLVSRRFIMTAMAVAASVLLLVFIWQPWQPSMSLYEQYAQFPVADLTSRSTGDLDLTNMQQAYNAGDFTTAIAYFDQYLSSNREDYEISMLNGISNLQVENFSRALALLAKVVSSNSAFKNDARYYLALTYLKMEDIPRCKTFLEAIPEGADKYTNAKDLLSKLQ
ncbi:MAG: tetratricopeptide repeat protein [Bacteroidota bacterium]